MFGAGVLQKMQIFVVGSKVSVLNIYHKEYPAIVKGLVNNEKFSANYLIKFEEKDADGALKAKSATFPYEIIDQKNLKLYSPPAQWRTGLFDIFAQPGGPRICATTWFCPCVVYGKNVARMGPSETACGGNAIGGCLLFACVPAAIVGSMNRAAIRQKYAIPGSITDDCLLWQCCPLCALIQVEYP